MKPVDLRPAATAVPKQTDSAGPSSTTIGAIAIGVVGILGVAAFFALGRVDTLKSTTADMTKKAGEMKAEQESTLAQIKETGGSVETNQLQQIATSYEQDVVDKVSNRRDYYSLIREINGTLPNQQSYYRSLNATSSDGGTVTLKGVVPNWLDLAAIRTRINATDALENAQITNTKKIVTNKGKRKIEFEVTASLVAIGETSDVGSGLVSNGPETGSDTLSTKPSPKSKKTSKYSVSKPVEPVNSFASAAVVAGGDS